MLHSIYCVWIHYATDMVTKRAKKKYESESKTDLGPHLVQNKRVLFKALYYFGNTFSVKNMFTCFGWRLILHALGRYRNEKVQITKIIDMHNYKRSISAYHALLPDVFAVVDSLQIYLQQYSDVLTQNMFKNG